MRRNVLVVCAVSVLLVRIVLSFIFGMPQYNDPNNEGILSGPRHFLEDRLMHVFHEPQASLASGILLGSRSSIPYDLKQDFKAVGLMHVVAVSGFNMVIIITVMTQLLVAFNRRWASLVALVGIIIFTLMVGASAAVVRAAIMSVLRLVAWFIGRPQYAPRLFILTVAGMVMWSPSLVWDDIGFQLTVAATGGLIWLNKPLTKILQWVPEKFALRENATSTLAATIMTTPIVWWHFATFSILSIPVNLLVLPLVPWLMLGSFLSLFFGLWTAVPTTWLFNLMLFFIERGAFFERLLH